ncbi:sensor histidine kinase [Dyadobacter sp. NIV53]|uniref:sensor histidine kinase n=1 Tax=Dyadobacter sp. NIV53 TaxID=2861765 RepID=UPI001C86F905|nr:histidine kinase [Dyadobacter sp. NIV53]
MFDTQSLKPFKGVWTQAAFWVGYFLFEWLNTGANFDNFEWTFRSISLHLPLIMIAAYWHLLVTVRRFLMNGQMIGFWISLIGGLVVFGILRRSLNYFWFYPNYFPQALHKPFWYLPKLLAETTQLHLIVALFVTVELVKNTLQQQRLSETYRREKLAAEYRLLQSQVQPHFLFNTLNNLVSVSLHNPNQMPNLLHRLGGLLSYQLHESHQDHVPLAKEIAYLNDYISLEKIRYGDRLDIQTNFSSLTNANQIKLPPMLLLTFVENAFKHGAAQTEGLCWIIMNLSIDKNRLVFSVENSVPENQVPSSSGLGLINLRKRLDILFPGDYEIVTMPEDEQFLAVLKFNIS